MKVVLRRAFLLVDKMNIKMIRVGLLLGALLPLGVHAGLLSDEEARQGILDLKAQQAVLSRQQQTMDERITRMETALQGYPDLVMRLDSMSQELAQMRGRLDTLANQLTTEDKRFHDLYADLDSRLKVLEAAQPKPDGAGATVDPNNPDAQKLATTKAGDPGGGEAQAPSADYDAALAVFNAGNYTKSKKMFDAFIKANPNDSKVPNALYWVGMNQLLLKDFKGARATNHRLVRTYPDSVKAPDALLNLASAWLGLGEPATAKATWKMIVNNYPNTSAAVKAKARLRER